jgi:hypothetical protein
LKLLVICITKCRSYIIKEDLEHFLSAKKAAKAFDMLDVDHDGKVPVHSVVLHYWRIPLQGDTLWFQFAQLPCILVRRESTDTLDLLLLCCLPRGG